MLPVLALALALALLPALRASPPRFALATPRPIPGNAEYMERLAAARQILRAPPTSPTAPFDPTGVARLKGASYIPSTARNAIQHWHNYSSALTRRELGFAAGVLNHIKLTLTWVNWFIEPTPFLANLEDTIAAAAALNFSISLALFEGPGEDPGPDAPSLLTSGQYATHGWLSSPGFSQLGNATLLPVLDAYVAALTLRYARDARVVGWDVLFQPNLCDPTTDPTCHTKAFLARYLASVASAVNPALQWTTTSIIPGAEACDALRLPGQGGGRTAVAFENYNGNRGAVGGDSGGVLACGQQLSPTQPLPVLLTASIGRQERPPSGVCETIFEAYGLPFMDIPPHDRVGYILPGLMLGVDEFTVSGNQGLVWPNGTWYAAEERACLAAPVPPLPPPPPGPPPAALNYTTPDGLRVGLRAATRAVQALELADDARWFGNFSFVPPLWGYIPDKPRRDFSGCHHVGDATLRIQPAASTNASDWAFYSSAQASSDVPVDVLPVNDPTGLVLDAANLTRAIVSTGGQDTRFPFTLHLTRTLERMPAGGPGFVLRWNLSLPAFASGGVRVGGLGFSLVSDTFFGGTNNTQIAAAGSFLDAHVGLGSAFATFTRADGSDTLLVTPCGVGEADPPPAALRSGMEAWRPILEDPVPPNQGIYEWTVHSQAWASEWAVNAQAPMLTFPSDPAHAAAWPHPQSPWPSWHLAETVHVPNPRPWNPPTSLVLQPGQWADYALCFSRVAGAAGKEQARGPRGRDAALAALRHPMLLSVPGYVLGGDMGNATLFITLPTPLTLASASCEDGAGILGLGAPYAVPTLGPAGASTTTALPLLPAALAHSRARLLLTFSNGATASLHYYILPPLSALTAAYGAFAATTSYLPRSTPDPFGRSASFMPWDREDGVRVLQDGRPFVVGLSDDAGGGRRWAWAQRPPGRPLQRRWRCWMSTLMPHCWASSQTLPRPPSLACRTPLPGAFS